MKYEVTAQRLLAVNSFRSSGGIMNGLLLVFGHKGECEGLFAVKDLLLLRIEAIISEENKEHVFLYYVNEISSADMVHETLGSLSKAEY